MISQLVRTALLPTAILLFSPLLLAQDLRVSPDTTTVLGGVKVADGAIAQDDLAGNITLPAVGFIPNGTDLTAYHLRANGDQLMAFDTTVAFTGVTIEPGDVLRFDGTTYSLEFDASAEALPSGVYVDAITQDGADLLLSFDTAVSLDGFTFDDADLVSFLSTGFAPAFNSVSAGIADGLDLDAANVLTDGTLLLSFDGSGSIGNINFDDEDVLGFDLSNLGWSLVYDGSTQHEGWLAADLDALSTGGLSSGGACTPAPDPDLNDDTVVNILDVSIVGSCFGSDPLSVASCTIADTNCDSNVDFIDLNYVIASYGQSGF